VPVEITDLRASFLWTPAVPDLTGPSGAHAPLAALATTSGVQLAFDQAVAGAGSGPARFPDRLEPPWPAVPSAEAAFWGKLVDGYSEVTVNGRKASRNLVPLRAPIGPAVSAPGWDYVRLSVFVHPVACSLLVQARSTTRAALDEAVARVSALRADPVVVAGQGGAARRLRDVVADTLPAIATAYGAATIELPAPDPFTVVTVAAADVPSGFDAATDPAVLPALQALTRWAGPTAVPLVASDQLTVEDHLATDIIAAGRRSRVHWFPSQFATAAPDAPRLGRRHAALTLLSMQVDALARFLVDIAPRTGDATPAQRAWAELAAKQLGRLHGASSDQVYRSPTVRRQCHDSDYVEPINAVRQWVGLPALTE
jgi:hypothetical protein